MEVKITTMRIPRIITIFFIIVFSFTTVTAQRKDLCFLSYIVDPKTSSIEFYWKDDNGQVLRSIQNLQSFVESKGNVLTFAMNGGMYKKDNSPQGLFIYHRKTLVPIDTLSGAGNFYLKPNGIFTLLRATKLSSVRQLIS